MLKARTPLVALAMSLTMACAGAGERTSTSTERDSAGVRIVESTGPMWDTSRTWGPESATLTIGSESGGPGQQLHRVAGAVRLGDGTLVIANAGSLELFRYDARGAFLGATGREGDGPGEFRALSWLGRMRGDSLITWDRGLNRVTIFSPRGEYARDYAPKLTENPMSLEVKGAMSGGRLLLARGASFIPADGKSGVQRQPITGWVIDSAGRQVQAFGPFPGEAVFLESRQPGAMVRMPVPYGAATLFATGRDAVHIVDTERFELRTYAPNGQLMTVARRPHTAQPVQPADVAALIDAQLENLPPVQSIRDGMRAGLERVPPARTLPAIGAIHVDAEENVWMREGGRPGDSTATWTLFDREGRWLARIPMPAALRVLEIDRDYLLAADRDELGVERVRAFALRRPTG